MKTYLGVKRIQAEPCEKDGIEGYRVIYPDGYESWSPKDVFEKAYFPIENDDPQCADNIDNFLAKTEIVTHKIDSKTGFVKIIAPTAYVEIWKLLQHVLLAASNENQDRKDGE